MGMMDDFNNEIDFDEMGFDDELPPEESGNRTFLIVAGILGGVLLLSLIGIAAYAMLVVPPRQAAKLTQVAEINAQNTEIALSSQLTAEASEWTATPTITNTPLPTSSPTATQPAATETPVIAATDSETQQANQTATQAAVLTEQAEDEEPEATSTPQATALPETGFADDFGVPTLVLMAAVLLVMIILSRRLRKSTS
jgi:hypothetical protein